MNIRVLLVSILVGVVGGVVTALPGFAAGLEQLSLDRGQNRLDFTTDRPVQPKAHLLSNPTRLVIELPGLVMDYPTISQPVDGAFRSLRAMQVDDRTVRLVLELAPGYTLDPGQIRFRGLSPTQWQVQLPTPQPIGAITAAPVPPPAATPTTAIPLPPTAQAELQQIQVTADGFFLRTQGNVSEVTIQRSDDRRRITLTLGNTAPAAQLSQRDQVVNRYQVDRITVVPLPASPTTTQTATQVVLAVASDSPDWVAMPSQGGGIVLLPQRTAAALAPVTTSLPISPQTRPQPNPQPVTTLPPRTLTTVTPTPSATISAVIPLPPVSSAPVMPPSVVRSAAPVPALATVQRVEVDATGGQLLIQTDRAVTYTGRWSGNQYQVLLSPARLSRTIRGPQLTANSPLQQVRLQQVNPTTVAVIVTPAAGVRIESPNAVSSQLVALPVRFPPVPITTPPLSPPPSLPPVTSPPTVPSLPPSRPVPQGRVVVVIDPGHGGPDPGAVGIGGLQEKQVVLAIAQQVAALLQQQGIYVVLTRTDDRDLDLEPRVQIAEQVQATLFVSIHANSIGGGRTDINGVETYYYASGSDLARLIQNNIIQQTGMDNRGIKQARFYVIRRTSMPSVLVETGFVTGYEDAPRLSNPNSQRQIATAIATGILQYLQQTGTLR